ncbi:MAG: thiolase domain-containing protein [Anaerolineales bacterium]|nr:thiolase domain-containing protein [Anaerolineales bacterium]
MRDVSIVGIGQVPIEKSTTWSLRQLGTAVVQEALNDANVESVDALFASNMLADELQGQKHLAALIADEAGLTGIEALEVEAATASGAAALRMGYLAVMSGEADVAVVVGVEKMSEGVASPALTKALDAEREVADGATLISKNADLMRLYTERYDVPDDGLFNFPVNAHRNAKNNPNALFRNMSVSPRSVKGSRMVHAPLRLLDCSPICDGAAAVVLVPTEEARAFSPHPVQILASSVVTDRFRVEDRPDPLWLEAAHHSAQKAFRQANVNREDVSFLEVHDAFTIMACLLLEAAGFAPQGEGWRLAADKRISLKGEIPISTMGGLKARGHPIGATALYQTCECVLQLTGRAGKNQVRDASIGMTQSVGAAATTVITHILGSVDTYG